MITLNQQVAVDGELVMGIKGDLEHMVLADILRGLWFLRGRRQLAQESLVRVHRRCHEEALMMKVSGES